MKNLNIKLQNPERKPSPQLFDLATQISKHVKNMRFEYGSGSEMDCYIGWEKVGRIGFGVHSRYENCSGTSTHLYSVYSRDYINNAKAPYHEKVSKHIRPVVKECAEVFKTTKSSKVAKEIYDSVSKSTDRICARHEESLDFQDRFWNKIYSNRTDYSIKMLKMFAYKESFPEPDKIDEEVIDNMKTRLHAYDVSRKLHSEISNNVGWFVRVERDGTYNVVNLETLWKKNAESADDFELECSTKNFDELPDMIQEKLTLLKMQEEDACMMNTGIVCSGDRYFVSKANMDHLV